MNIKELREKFGFSQQELADRIGVPKGRVNGWERGNNPKAEDTKALEKFFSELENKYSHESGDKNFVTDSPMDQKETFYAELIEKNEVYALIPKAVLSDYKIVPDKIMDIIIRSNEGEKEALIAKYEVIIRGLEIKSAQLEAENKELRQITIKPK